MPRSLSPRHTIPPGEERRIVRGRKARFTQILGPDDPKIIECDRELKALRLQDHINQALATAPPLSSDQRSRLAELLKPARKAITAARLGKIDKGEIA